MQYFRDNDPNLYQLFSDQLISDAAFMPDKKEIGVTILHPSAEVIQAVLDGPNSEDIGNVIQSLVLLDRIDSFDEFNIKKSDIPTRMRKKLPITKVDAGSVTLTNGTVITAEPGFNAPRGGVMIYRVSGIVPWEDAADATFENAKQKAVAAKMGGADFSVPRSELFRCVLREMFPDSGPHGDPAMELLVELYTWASKSRPELAQLIQSQCSYDTLASLAIVLQPNKSSGYYISDADLSEFARSNPLYTGEFKRMNSLFSVQSDVSSKYDTIISSFAGDTGFIDSSIRDGWQRVPKAALPKFLYDFYQLAQTSVTPVMRRVPVDQMIAEAELRAVCALEMQHTSDYRDYIHLFTKHALNEPYMVSRAQIGKGSIFMLKSVVALICRSDARLYLPGVNRGGAADTDAVLDGSRTVSISEVARGLRAVYRKQSNDKIARFRSAIGA